MRLRSSPLTNWSSLPPEIRRMILDAIVDQKKLGWASLACVSKEWHMVIGERNMCRLELRVSCLDDFGKMIIRQRELVQHIYLNIDLPRYNCRVCHMMDSQRKALENSHVVSRSIWKLFTILSAWKSTGRLTLELNAKSASDSEHWFKNFHFDDDADQKDSSGTSPSPEIDHQWHDPRHGWVNGRQITHPSYSAMQRLFGIIPLQFELGLPRVAVVTCLMIRRQFRHCLMPSQLAELVSKLYCLTDMIYEPWQPIYTSLISSYNISLVLGEHPGGFNVHLPQRLKRLTLFRDFNQYLSESLDNGSDRMFRLTVAFLKDNSSKISENLAYTSLNLEQLAVSFLINAEDFLQACKHKWSWRYLQSLALTSQLLQDTRSQQDINGLLVRTAKLVLRMPRLITMALWGGSRGKACAFIFIIKGAFASITWRGTHDLELSSSVVEAWEDVAKLRSLELRVSNQHIQETIRSHGDAIYCLNLPCQVVEPRSLWQIRMEGPR